MGRTGDIIIFTSNKIEQEFAEKIINKFNLSKAETDQIIPFKALYNDFLSKKVQANNIYLCIIKNKA